MVSAKSLADQSRPALVGKLRRLGGLFALYGLLLLASAHWIGQDIEETIGTQGISRNAMKAGVADAVGRLNAVLIISGLSIFPAFLFGALVTGRFVRRHFEEIESITRRKSQFVSMVTHEMRTPLNAIKGFADLLASGASGELTPEQTDSLREIQKGSENMRALINDILDLSKIEAGAIALNPAPFEMAGLMDEVAASLRPVGDRRKAHFIVQCPAGLRAVADRARIRQVLFNLVSNAVKFSSEEGIIMMSAGGLDGVVSVRVVDSGCGMEEEEVKHLFEEFRQTRAGRQVNESTGLGLAISRKLVELHGGLIGAASMPGMGTVIHFTLPEAPPEPIAADKGCSEQAEFPADRVEILAGRS